jgi:hypothetical protein
MGVFNKEADLEAAPVDQGFGYVDETVVHEKDFGSGNTWYAKLQGFVGRFGVEQRGIERVPEDERTDTGMSKIGTLVGSRGLSSWENVVGTDRFSLVDVGQHGGILVRYRSLGHPGVCSRLCGLG